jgi:hypothetical protein
MSPREELATLLKRLSQEQKELIRQLVEEVATGSSASALLDELGKLDDEQIARLLEIARAMAAPITEWVNPKSRVLTPKFTAEFRSRLQAHHATHTTPMDRLGFENAFLSASRAANRSTQPAPSRTTRFYDATIDGARTALKTEGAQSMKPDQLHISKLSEAAWIQDMRSARTRRTRTEQLVNEFLAAVKRIFILRYYVREPAPYYELVEVPVRHFQLVLGLPLTAYASDSPRLPVEDKHGFIMEFHLDRSDSKITVGKIQKSRCIVHGDWRLS